MTTYLAGLDIGTSSVKLSLWNIGKEEIVLQSTEDYPTFQDSHKRVYQDTQEVFQAVLRQLRRVVKILQSQSADSSKSLIVVLDTALHTLLLLDEHMNPITDVIPWIDERADSVAAEIAKIDLAREIHRQTGCPVDPVYPLYKLIWFKKNEPELFQRAVKVSSIKDFLLFKLTGKFVVDFAVASGTGYFDIRKHCWAKDLLRDLSGLDCAKLPDLVSPYEMFDISQEIKSLLDAQRISIKLVTGISDAAASSIGATFGDRSLMTISMGTSAAVRRISNRSLPEDKIPDNGIWCYAVDENSYIIGLALKNGGCLVEWWVKNFLGGTKYEEIGKLLGEILERKGSDKTHNWLIFLPTVYGMRSPWWIPNRTGAFIGLSGTSNINEATKAVMEGLAFNLRRAFEVVLDNTKGFLGEISGSVATGGMCEIPNWLGFLTSVINKPIVARQNRYDASNGTIMLYLREIPKNILTKLSEGSRIFEPEERIFRDYNLLYSSWLDEMGRWERR